MNDRLEANWEDILTLLEEQNCALVLGPDVLTRPISQRSFQEALSEYLSERSTGESDYIYYSEDSFFYFEPGRTHTWSKRRTMSRIQAFFRSLSQEMLSNPIHSQIAEIPFHLIISLSPDTFLQHAFQRKDISCQFAFYQKKEKPSTSLFPPTSEVPLIYNLLGHIDEKKSLVFTYEGLFEYIESVFGRYGLPDVLKESLDECEHFIFLGAPYDAWYLKLVLHMLNMHKQNKTMAAYDESFESAHQETIFYQNHFRTTFIPIEIQTFVENLHEQVSKSGMLRTPLSPAQRVSGTLQTARALLRDAESKAAIDLLTHEAQRQQASVIENNCILISNRISSLASELRGGTISSDDESLRRNKITQSILSLIEEFERFMTSPI